MTVNNFLSQPVGEMTRISIIFFVFMFAVLHTHCTHSCKHSLTNFPPVFTNLFSIPETTDTRLPKLLRLPFQELFTTTFPILQTSLQTNCTHDCKLYFWWDCSDLNRDGLLHTFLRRKCLPIPPQSHFIELQVL